MMPCPAHTHGTHVLAHLAAQTTAMKATARQVIRVKNAEHGMVDDGISALEACVSASEAPYALPRVCRTHVS